MNTASVVTEVSRVSPDWTRAQIVTVINDVTKLLLKTERDSSIYVDPTTGDLPYLTTTTARTYTVSIPGVTIWKIRAIVTDMGNMANFEFDLNNWDRDYEPVRYKSRIYQPAPCDLADESDTGTSGLCTATFLSEPQASSTLYRIMAYKSPSEVLSESTPIPIGDQYRSSVVIPAVLAMMDGMDNGRYAEQAAYVDSLKKTLEVDKDTDRIYGRNYSW